jgi:uncharacterized membrane protein
MPYLLLKVVHVAAVVLFLGNIITGMFWKLQADPTDDPRIIAHTFRTIRRSDRWFTIPGVILILLAGSAAALVGRFPILATGWILWSIVLFGVSGLAFSLRVAPLQVRLEELARSATDSGRWDRRAYHALARRWELWGLLATLTPLAAMVLMIVKPALPAL